MTTGAQFKSLNIAVLTVSDTRGEDEDVSGKLLVKALQDAGHQNCEKAIVKDDIIAIRAVVSNGSQTQRSMLCSPPVEQV